MLEENKNKDWQINEGKVASDDPLLACLMFLAAHYDHPVSVSTLTERIPLEDNRLTPELFVRVSKRANLASKINQISLEEIEDFMLPAVLLLKDSDACVLLDKTEAGYTILMGKTGQGQIEVSSEQLEEKYSGYAILVKPLFRFNQKQKKSERVLADHWLWAAIKSSWPIYTEVLTASVLINLFGLALPLFVMNVYDRVVPNQAMETMWVLASGILIVFLFDLLLKSLRAYFIDVASKKTDVQLSSLIFEHILGIQMASRPSSLGAFANTIQSFEMFRDFITSTTMTVLVDLPFVFIYLLVIYYIGGMLVLIPLFVLPLVFILGLLLQYPLRRLTKTSYELSQEKHATLIESLSGIEALKTTGAEGMMQGRFERTVLYAAKLGAKLRFWVSWSINFTVLMQQMASVAIVIFGVYMIIEGELTVGGLIACTILTGRALAPMAQVAGIFSRYYQAVKALHSINEVMKLPTDITPGSSYLHRPHLKGKIQFNKVSYTYPNQMVPVLENISFSIQPGERVGIIGRTGSGKSTVAKLIMGLYQPGGGSIYIDDTDYLQLNPADLRKQIGYVPQDIILFFGSVKENIRVGAPYVDDKELLRAATIAGVTNFTDNHPEGFDRNVGERGNQLSSGQKQAVAVARSLIHSPKILIMDEPTSSMDDGSERKLRDNLTQSLSKDTSLILVTHKASMLALVDRLIVVDNGKILADGRKESVLKALKAGIRPGKKQ